MNYFKKADSGIGIEINKEYIDNIQNNATYKELSSKITLYHL